MVGMQPSLIQMLYWLLGGVLYAYALLQDNISSSQFPKGYFIKYIQMVFLFNLSYWQFGLNAVDKLMPLHGEKANAVHAIVSPYRPTDV